TTGGGTTGGATTGGATTGTGGGTTEKFSFFVTSLVAMQELSGSEDGFGGDLRFGETEDGKQVDAIDRIGEGPWYDRLGRLVANNKEELLNDRPIAADEAIIDEDGVPNHQPDPSQPEVDNHDILTGTNDQGKLYSATATCKDWTAKAGDKEAEGRPRGALVAEELRRSFPGGSSGAGGPGGPGGNINMANWMSSLDESGCAPGINLLETGGPLPNEATVGSGGGYGGIYCFALTP
ncbi:hypothetical protein BE20_21890, partial [Sorangium cellulosum]